MFRSQITIHDNLAGVTAHVEELARRATLAAAEAAAAAAQAGSSIDLQLELISPHPDFEGFVAGIRSRKKGRASTVEIARFFDGGTLGGRKRALKRPRRESWTVKRSSGPYTAHRHDVAGKGIPAERFFLKARVAGRRAMVSVVKQNL